MQQIQIPPLAEGEIYLCGFVNAVGDVEHVILLPGDSERATWQEQLDWAKSIGGDLPTRPELAVAFAKHRDQFQKAGYWSNETDADEPGWAWCTYFYGGYQNYYDESSKLRARAVRRLTI
ncbi:hypothetical protein ADM96_20135 [Burkholderia sp. ST111]|nr:hypothetical protein ADM96_20135 [Burkholderia sp. ST111]